MIDRTEIDEVAEVIALAHINQRRIHLVSLEEARGFGGWNDAIDDAKCSLDAILKHYQLTRKP